MGVEANLYMFMFLTGHMLERLEAAGLMEKMNLIITSDHGMVNISTMIEVDTDIDPELYTSYGACNWQIVAEEGTV